MKFKAWTNRQMAKKVTISSELTALYKRIADKVDEKTSLDDQLKILDRGIKLEQIKQRLKDDDYGKEFDMPSDDDGESA